MHRAISPREPGHRECRPRPCAFRPRRECRSHWLSPGVLHLHPRAKPAAYGPEGQGLVREQASGYSFLALRLVGEEQVMAEPLSHMPAAAGGGHLRVSDAGREQVIDILKAAFVQGRLAKDEFDVRVGWALASRTCAELAAVTADLPAGLTAGRPPEPARPPGKRPVLLRPGPAVTVATVLYAGMWPLAFALPQDSDGYPAAGVGLVGSGSLVYMLVVALVAVWVQMRATRQEKHSGGRLPGRPAPGAGGRGSRRLPSAGPGRQLPAGGPDRRHTAQAARRRLARSPLPVRGHCATGALVAGPARG
jgi:hypothetical protein